MLSFYINYIFKTNVVDFSRKINFIAKVDSGGQTNQVISFGVVN